MSGYLVKSFSGDCCSYRSNGSYPDDQPTVFKTIEDAKLVAIVSQVSNSIMGCNPSRVYSNVESLALPGQALFSTKDWSRPTIGAGLRGDKIYPIPIDRHDLAQKEDYRRVSLKDQWRLLEEHDWDFTFVKQQVLSDYAAIFDEEPMKQGYYLYPRGEVAQNCYGPFESPENMLLNVGSIIALHEHNHEATDELMCSNY